MASLWRWKYVDDRVGRNVVVAADDETNVVLCASGNKLLTRDAVTGVLVSLEPQSNVGRMIAAAPQTYAFCQEFWRVKQDLRIAIRSGNHKRVDEIIDSLADQAMNANAKAEPLEAEAANG